MRQRPPWRALEAPTAIATLLALLQRPKIGTQLHPTRLQILRAVTESPGIPLTKLRDSLPLGWGTLYHHVWRLVKDGELETVTSGRRRLLFRPGAASQEALQARGILEGRTARLIAREIAKRQRTSFKELVAVTGESERATYYHLKRLLDAGLVTSTSRTRHYSLTPSPKLAHYLATIDDE